ncbi:TPA: hypothetical protein NGH35_002275 [Legionella pneumophila]|nr:hypothetical protein [Legionella pneumophila]
MTKNQDKALLYQFINLLKLKGENHQQKPVVNRRYRLPYIAIDLPPTRA